MAYGSYAVGNRDYDLSLFESVRGTAVPKTAPVKKKRAKAQNNIIELPEIQVDKSQRKKHNVSGLVFGFVMAAVVAVAVGLIISGQVRLAELNQEIVSAETKLAHTQSVQTQMQAKIESTLSADAVEKCAKEKLNMVKATNSQKEYISLSQGDKAQVFSDGNATVFEAIGETVSSLWS
ncbi:MAG: septum formation initiator family protein [Eubacteriales bacterium]|nr:septum formation initiator family protein [Eubacteriales bacterium]